MSLDIHEQLRVIMEKNAAVERSISPNSSDYDDAIAQLTNVNAAIADLHEVVSKDSNDKHTIFLLSQAKSCNLQRIKILTKLNAKRHGKVTYSYRDYRHDVERLKELTRERTELYEVFKADSSETQAQLEHSLNSQMHSEDAALINILVAMSAVDGELHRQEAKVIGRHYKSIVQQPLEPRHIEDAYNQLDNQVSNVLIALGNASNAIHLEVKKLMLLSALEVAIADRQLHDNERHLLDQISTSLDIPANDVEEILAIIT